MGRGRPKGQTTIESWMIANGKDFDVFYTTKKDKTITAAACHHGRKVHTERLIVISGDKEKPIATTLIKVTLLPLKKD
jgi:hypothetical protein